MPGTVFVTVGTTKFDSLIAAVDRRDVGGLLITLGYTKLVMQVGKGSYQPQVLCPTGSMHHVFTTQEGKKRGSLVVEWFTFAPSLKEYMQSADLVISHAGSGSLFEGLALRKAIIAVPNPILMHNHQAELAGRLAADKYLVCSTTEELLEVLQVLDTSVLVPYTPGDARALVAEIDALMQF